MTIVQRRTPRSGCPSHIIFWFQRNLREVVLLNPRPPRPSLPTMSAPVVAPHHEPTTGGQVIMLFVFGASFVVMVIWQVLIYLSAYFPALLPKRPALAVAEEGESDEKEKERRELQIAIDQPSTWASVLHNEGPSPRPYSLSRFSTPPAPVLGSRTARRCARSPDSYLHVIRVAASAARLLQSRRPHAYLLPPRWSLPHLPAGRAHLQPRSIHLRSRCVSSLARDCVPSLIP